MLPWCGVPAVLPWCGVPAVLPCGGRVVLRCRVRARRGCSYVGRRHLGGRGRLLGFVCGLVVLVTVPTLAPLLRPCGVGFVFVRRPVSESSTLAARRFFDDVIVRKVFHRRFVAGRRDVAFGQPRGQHGKAVGVTTHGRASPALDSAVTKGVAAVTRAWLVGCAGPPVPLDLLDLKFGHRLFYATARSHRGAVPRAPRMGSAVGFAARPLATRAQKGYFCPILDGSVSWSGGAPMRRLFACERSAPRPVHSGGNRGQTNQVECNRDRGGYGEEGRGHRGRGSSCRAAAQCDVPDRARERAQSSRAHQREDAAALHSHPPRGPCCRRTLALRPVAWPDRVPLQMIAERDRVGRADCPDSPRDRVERLMTRLPQPPAGEKLCSHPCEP